MKSNYKRLGDYIRQVDVRNRDLAVTDLVGLTIDKAFIPSVANTIGTDLSSYKVISHNQFACSLMQVSRDGKMPVAIFKGDKAIMSPAYPMFEVCRADELLPEFLMMWFSRKEFDREVTFWAVGGVRGSLTWDDFMNLHIPVPPIEEQRKIVAEYQAVERRIENNRRLIATLEDAAQTIYRKMFIDNIDPNNLPDGWRMGSLSEIVECHDSRRKPVASFERNGLAQVYPYYGATTKMGYIDNYIFDGDYVLIGEDGSVVKEDGTPFLQQISGKTWVNNHAHVLSAKSNWNNALLYIALSVANVRDIITGGVQLKINQKNLMSFPIILPPTVTIKDAISLISPLEKEKRVHTAEQDKLISVLSVLLSKLSKI